VYYASAQGYIREVGMNFKESTGLPIWHMWANFKQINTNSGIACAVCDNKNHLYMHNSTAQKMQRSQWDYITALAWTMNKSEAAMRKLCMTRANSCQMPQARATSPAAQISLSPRMGQVPITFSTKPRAGPSTVLYTLDKRSVPLLDSIRPRLAPS